MGNLEHLINNIDEKIQIIQLINDYLINTLMPIINKHLYDNIIEKLSNDFIDSDINNFSDVILHINKNLNVFNIKNYSNKNHEYFIYLKYQYLNKNIILLRNRYDKFIDFSDVYENNIIYHITNYYFLKRNHININNIIYDKVLLQDNIKIILKQLNIKKLFNINDFMNSNKNIQNNTINFNKLYKHIFNQFSNFISSEDIYGKLDSYHYYITDFINLYVFNDYESIIDKKIISTIKQLLNKYQKTIVDYNIDKINYDICDCGFKMIIRSNTSELICIECGNIKNLIGTIFQDSQFYNQEGNRYKHGSYIPSRHCRYWIDRIQAKENTTIDKKFIDKIENCIKRDGIKNKKKISIEQFRKYLKETKLSVYNDHIPLIRKYITGITPPQLTHSELSLLFNYFDKSVKTYNNIKPKTKLNCIYYPYILYKILEIVIVCPKRRRNILCCIHLQGNKTLIDNDNNWKLICQKFDDLPYKPTNRNDIC